MTIDESSKILARGDDAAAEFIRLSLRAPTRGFDTESVYCEVKDGAVRWTIFEFLKCIGVAPEDSHPRRYWKRTAGSTAENRRKFLSLWALCLALKRGGCTVRLFLVNYRDPSEQVKLLRVVAMDNDTIETKDWVLTFDEWSTLYTNFNNRKEGSTWDAIPLLLDDAPLAEWEDSG